MPLRAMCSYAKVCYRPLSSFRQVRALHNASSYSDERAVYMGGGNPATIKIVAEAAKPPGILAIPPTTLSRTASATNCKRTWARRTPIAMHRPKGYRVRHSGAIRGILVTNA
jgi:hypothetical protein